MWSGPSASSSAAKRGPLRPSRSSSPGGRPPRHPPRHEQFLDAPARPPPGGQQDAGAGLIVLCTNTMHRCAEAIEAAIEACEGALRRYDLTFVQVAQPSRVERLLIMIAQAIFFCAYFVMYLFFPRTGWLD